MSLKYPDPVQQKAAFDEFKAQFDYWAKYNREPLWDARRPEDYKNRAWDPARDLDPDPRVNLGSRPAFGRFTQTEAWAKQDAQLLGQKVPELYSPSFPQDQWKAVKVLGRGGSAVVVHWTFDTSVPRPRRPQYVDVAVKESHNPSFDLYSEADIMESMSNPSEHIVQLRRKPRRNVTAEERGPLGEEWTDRVNRIVMEFCPLGDLTNLMNPRINTSLLFREITIWHIFENLVDALSMFEYGRELTVDPQTERVRGPFVTHANAFCHFDIKPENVFLDYPKVPDPADTTPSTVPIAKMGDFGLAKKHTSRLPQDATAYRRRGTSGYFAPEHFSPKWNFKDWKSSGVAGIYGRWTNVFGIGLLMWELVMLRATDWKRPLVIPYVPKIPITGPNGEILQPGQWGLSYGMGIEDTRYSAPLKSLVLLCLMEKAGERASIPWLKERCAHATKKGRIPGGFEPWADIVTPQPRTLPPNAPPPPPVQTRPPNWPADSVLKQPPPPPPPSLPPPPAKPEPSTRPPPQAPPPLTLIDTNTNKRPGTRPTPSAENTNKRPGTRPTPSMFSRTPQARSRAPPLPIGPALDPASISVFDRGSKRKRTPDTPYNPPPATAGSQTPSTALTGLAIGSPGYTAPSPDLPSMQAPKRARTFGPSNPPPPPPFAPPRAESVRPLGMDPAFQNIDALYPERARLMDPVPQQFVRRLFQLDPMPCAFRDGNGVKCGVNKRQEVEEGRVDDARCDLHWGWLQNN